MKKRPNFLLITSDMQRADCFGGFNGRGVKAPHIEALARDGTRFDTCITPNIVCQPARASILTGMLPLTHGVFDNGIDLEPALGQRGFAATLGRAGYQTAFLGKAHFATFETFQPTGTPECRHSFREYPAEWTGPYMGFDYVNLCVMGHLHRKRPPERPPRGRHYERWFYERGRDDEALRLHTTTLPPDTGAANTWNSALPASWHTSTWVADRTIEVLRTRDRSRPFCIWASFPDPHHPYAPPEPWSRLYPHDAIQLPDHRKLDLDRRPWWHRAALEGEPQISDPRLREHRKSVSRILTQSDEQLAHMISNYFGMISLIDHNVGRMLDVLQDLADADDTIVIYTTDHGDFLGDHGLFLKGPMPYEGVLRVGMIARGPGIPAGKIIEDPVSTLDLPATFYDYADLAKPDGMQSESLRPLIEGVGSEREVAYSEWRLQAIRCGVALELRTVRTKTHKLTLELGSGAGEMYDLANDPAEMQNLFDDSGYSRVRKQLEEMLHERPGSIREQFAKPVGIY